MSLDYLAQSVEDWNKRGGVKYNQLKRSRFTDEWWNMLSSQARVNLEEAKEISEAVEEKDHVNLLKEVIDNFITAAGLLAMMKASGYNFETAIDEVLENNDLKIFNTYSEAVEKLEELQEESEEIFSIEESYVYGVPSYVIKDSKGKIRKYKNFPKVDLTKYVPE